MSRDPKHDILFEPIQLGPKTLRNRFFQTPHCNTAGSERPGMQAGLRATKAEGGWAAVCTENCSIHPESDRTPRVLARLWDDDDVRNLSVMTDAVHRWNSLAGVELWYGGVHTACAETRAVPRGPSQIASDSDPLVVPSEMGIPEIRELAAMYGAAAERAVAAGFDIIYVDGSASNGPIQFLSAFYNKRTDEYGGDLESRAKFWLECLDAVRSGSGGRCAITTRLSVESIGEAGVHIEEALEFIRLADHLVDFWDVSIGTTIEWGEGVGASRFRRENWQAPWTSRVRDATAKPIVNVGRFTNPDTMANAIRSGQCDIIGAARPSIADPFLPRKIEEGRLDDIRECIGCNICVSRYEGGAPLICTQNATSGEEYRRGWHPERFTAAENADKDVLVIGAGPAGMECARVLGMRGMRRIHLVDTAAELGGHVRWVSQLPGLGEWGRVIDYRRIQLDKLKNVELILNTELDAVAAAEYGAEIVVVATGSAWSRDGLNAFTHAPIPGAASNPRVQTPEDIVRDGQTTEGRVLVYDGEGYFLGVSLAEKLARAGSTVDYVTPFAVPAPYMQKTGEQVPMYRLLRSLGVNVRTASIVHEINDGSVTIGDALISEDRRDEDFDYVVLVTQRTSKSSLYFDLREATAAGDIESVYRIGDCVAPRLIADSVFDGHRLAREIDASDPATPIPFIRERRLAGTSTNDDYEGVLQRYANHGA